MVKGGAKTRGTAVIVALVTFKKFFVGLGFRVGSHGPIEKLHGRVTYVQCVCQV